MEIRITEATHRKDKPKDEELRFGTVFTDHMFLMDYTAEQGWHDARIVPYGALSLDPSTMVLHYAQETFEGLKAYRALDGRILLFRPEKNARRMADSNVRLCMPKIPEEMFVEAVEALVKIDCEWVPHAPGTSLYIRPVCFASEAAVGLHQSGSYTFVIIASPVGSYYKEGLKPVKIYVEDEYVRACKGGTGFAKCGGNYASSIIAQAKAEQLGYAQVLWLDGVHRRYIEEVGSMNIMFKINGEIYTAPCIGTVLPGITRDSCIHILKDWGYAVHEEYLDIHDFMAMAEKGLVEEVWGCGTAAVISPVGQIDYQDKQAVFNHFRIGALTKRLYDELTSIQWGLIEDKYGWSRRVM